MEGPACYADLETLVNLIGNSRAQIAGWSTTPGRSGQTLLPLSCLGTVEELPLTSMASVRKLRFKHAGVRGC